MKKQLNFVIIAILSSIYLYSQNNNETLLIDAFEISSLGRQYEPVSSSVLGSPYLYPMFASAKVKSVNLSVPMRYNVYNDEFEFINSKKDTLVLTKVADCNDITFSGTNTTYHLVDYTNKRGSATSGYLIFLYQKKDYVLYKKQTISFVKERVAANSFEISSPAKFIEGKDVFYFKNKENGIIEFPSNKKNLLKLFPEKKADIETFLKQNTIDFDKESDKIKVIEFLSMQS